MAMAISIVVVDYMPLYIAAICAMAVVAVYEVLVATKYIRNKILSAVSLFFVAMIPVIFVVDRLRENLPLLCSLFLFLLFIVMIYKHEKVSFAAVTLVGFVAILIPLSLSCLLFIRYFEPLREHGIFLMVFTLTVTFLGDSGAYFVGTFLGKHKMAPKISPKKSWEGFVGGLITAGLAGFAAPYVYEFCHVHLMGRGILDFNPWLFAAAAVVCAALGVVGDFSASLVKRQCAVKDFGNIMPGHGGVLDRMDSVLFAAPFMYQFLHYVSPIAPVPIIV